MTHSHDNLPYAAAEFFEGYFKGDPEIVGNATDEEIDGAAKELSDMQKQMTPSQKGEFFDLLHFASVEFIAKVNPHGANERPSKTMALSEIVRQEEGLNGARNLYSRPVHAAISFSLSTALIELPGIIQQATMIEYAPRAIEAGTFDLPAGKKALKAAIQAERDVQPTAMPA